MVTVAMIVMINRVKWKWAVTYAKTAPHWYILQAEHPGLFWHLSRAIGDEGIEKEFKNSGHFYKYLTIGEYVFWRMGNIINRADKSSLGGG